MIAHIGKTHPSFFSPGSLVNHRTYADTPRGDQEKSHQDLVISFPAPGEQDLADADSLDSYVDSDEVSDVAEEKQDRQEEETNIAGIYLREMNRVPLLTRQKEIDLARRIQQGEKKIRRLIQSSAIGVEALRRLRETSRRGSLDGHSSVEIARRIIRKLSRSNQSSHPDRDPYVAFLPEMKRAVLYVESAKAEMIQANLRLVVSIAKIYINRGLSFLDLIQEGNMGLMKAVTRYDYTKGFKFSTYASWWIRQAITRAVADKSRTIRIPNHLLETRSKTVKAFHRLIKELGRDPFPEEIARQTEIPLSNVIKVMSLIQEPVSLETPVGDDGSKLEDIVGSEGSLTFNDDLIETMDLAKKVRELLSLLSPREEQIIRLRFGIGQPAGYTLDEIGKRFGISRERVRQIEERALQKLRHPAQSEPEEQSRVSASGQIQ
jgi:RNA polymerase primary sigma factor